MPCQARRPRPGRHVRPQQERTSGHTSSAPDLRQALQLHQTGRLHEAELQYRSILKRDPNNSDALHLLGLIASQAGKHGAAIACMRRALELCPTAALYHLNLGNAYRAAGDRAAALQCYACALKLRPAYADAHYNCGVVLQDDGRLDEAIAHYGRALEIEPGQAKAHNNLGNAYRAQGNLDAALQHYREALRIDPEYAFAHNNAANILQGRGEADAAFEHYQQALRCNPDYADAHYNMGTMLKDRQAPDAAVRHLREALRLQPDHDKAHVNLGLLLHRAWRLAEAGNHYREAVRLQPGHAESFNNLGVVLKEQGNLEEAYRHFNRALEINPDFAEAHSNLLLNLHYHAGFDAKYIFAEHQRWAQQHAGGQSAEPRVRANDPDPERRLRIGYVSPDFRRHSVAFFLESILEHHDHGRFEIFCYSDVAKPDAVTERCRVLADRWQEICKKPHEEVCALVQSDGIDILIDLAGHTANNRMPLFARKPAPVQVSAIGYPDTTGLGAVDYRITDSLADPPGAADALHTEALARLSGCFLCYRPFENSPPVAPLPALSSGFITLGSFNSLPKVTDEVVALWARILLGLPGSRLIMKCAQLGDGPTRARLQRLFEGQGIAAGRVELCGEIPSLAAHLDLYNRVDIALDPFPYNGTTTTCEALWMGVPVVTLAGDRHAARVGVSLLSAVGLPELIACSPRDYVDKAVALARDVARLSALRARLREQMRGSPLTDATGYTRRIEQTYRTIWQACCRAAQQAGSGAC